MTRWKSDWMHDEAWWLFETCSPFDKIKGWISDCWSSRWDARCRCGYVSPLRKLTPQWLQIMYSERTSQCWGLCVRISMIGESANGAYDSSWCKCSVSKSSNSSKQRWHWKARHSWVIFACIERSCRVPKVEWQVAHIQVRCVILRCTLQRKIRLWSSTDRTLKAGQRNLSRLCWSAFASNDPAKISWNGDVRWVTWRWYNIACAVANWQ